MWNPESDSRIRRMMITTVVVVGIMLMAVIFSFIVLQKEYEKTIAATDTERGETTTESVYLIHGTETGSNPYEKADHLVYTDNIRYTKEELSWLDSYGLCITRNEIYARHGRMFSDQNIQDYFNRKSWYVPQTSSKDFDESALNEVEKYNVELIRSYELQQGY